MPFTSFICTHKAMNDKIDGVRASAHVDRSSGLQVYRRHCCNHQTSCITAPTLCMMQPQEAIDPVAVQGSHTSHSIFTVVLRGTLFLILKSASIVDSIGENSIFPSSAVASSSNDSICKGLSARIKQSFLNFRNPL